VSDNHPPPSGEARQYRAIPLRNSDNVQSAQQILRGGQAEPPEILELAKALKAENRFSYARRLLSRASTAAGICQDRKLRKKIFQELALCTYKDEDLPADERLDRALEILCQIEDFDTTIDQETLGLLGSIHKRKWEVDNQRQNLERSLFYYLRGYEQGVVTDQGYTGINAAFVLDRLASLESQEAIRAGKESVAAQERRERAEAIRRDIVANIPPLLTDPEHDWVAKKWWYYATVAEAYFGLHEYDEALQWLNKGQLTLGQDVFEWELETCARQLAALARLQSEPGTPEKDFRSSPPWVALEEAFGAKAVARTAFAGKIGLALSGGGFRASLYHLGVLARLAELDVLRNVEVLSCVSGGSIVGAYYYLKVRKLLHTKTNAEIEREDYLQIVREMIDEFPAGVQRNIRTRVAVNPIRNFKMFWSRKYSRSTRAAELYQQYLYKKLGDKDLRKNLLLNECKIHPLTKEADGSKEPDQSFSPKYQNWRRDAKVPILVLNAATLNTGHTWQFTASWMGEAPAGIDSEIDGNDRLRRMYYEEAPKDYKQIDLGVAVGASAAVPGVFEPLTFDYLYPDRIVRLVDGGVCDNQGVASLLEQDCRVMLISDASGQMESQPAVSKGVFGVLLRTNSVFQARIRQAEYHDLKGRRRSGLLRGLMFVHLKGDLEVDPIDWVDCLDPFEASDDARPTSRRGPLTRYGIAKDIQELLSGIRTDLDSFSEAEAFALMTSAYRMTEYQFKYGHCVEGFAEPATSENWKFLEIEECMKGTGPGYDYLQRLLKAGSNLALKVWQIDPVLKYLARGILFLLAFSIAAAFYWWWSDPLPHPISQLGEQAVNGTANRLIQGLRALTFRAVAYTVFGLFSGYLLLRMLTSLVGDFMAQNIINVVRWKDTLRRIALATLISTVGFIASVVHIYIFDKRFLKLGSMGFVKRKAGIPTITSVDPEPVKSDTSKITVRGLDFYQGAKIRINGSDRVTTFLNKATLEAVLQTDDQNPGELKLSVINPAPGGSTNRKVTVEANSTPVSQTQIANIRS
jgi:predicted acylesterase/phospholipase RssA